MANLQSPTQVAGNNSVIYEAYYNVVDPSGCGSVGGMDAARFLKKSGLSDVILSKIWDLSDPGGRGCLDKTGMFVALKLVALVQNGKDLNISNINMDVPPPKLSDVRLPKPTRPPDRPPQPSRSNTPVITSLPPSAVDWSVKPSEKEKYEKLFESLQPANGLIPGNKVKNVLMESKLPFDTLGRIWDLADQDNDGMLNRQEFIVAMHLVYKALEKYAIPSTLPLELAELCKAQLPISNGAPLQNRPLVDAVKPEVLPSQILSQQPLASALTMKPAQSVVPPVPWVVSSDEKAKSDALFIKSDIDKDGFVSGQEIKDVFLQSGVPQAVLAHIWSLCDIKQNGKLNNEQFALAMWFVARCLKGIEPPAALTPEMVPPSFRSMKAIEGVVENNNTRYSNPELDMITKDIEELSREKLALETDIAQKEADIKIRSGEIKSLQSELDTLAATLKQLENQKGEAQKRLDDLKLQVDKLRAQATEQAEIVKQQEAELNSKKEQLEGLRVEEQRLEKLREESQNKLENLTTNLQDTQLNISQVKALITQLQEQTRQMNDAIKACDIAIETSDVSQVQDTALRIQPDFRSAEYTSNVVTNGYNNKLNEADMNNKNTNTSMNFATDFNDPFKSDPFKGEDEFTTSEPFEANFSNSNGGFSSDPFGDSYFGNTTSQSNAFGDFSKLDATPSTETDKDPFGCDPFAILHAPTRDGSAPPRPTSPSPALPPKKKQPPPRPAPPRPSQPPSFKKSPQPDAFGSDPFASGGQFADFSNFDAKIQADVPAKALDFIDDPFRDYRFEDPFNRFEDPFGTPFEDKKEEATTVTKTDNSKFATNPKITIDGRQSVPISTSGNLSIASNASGRASAPITLDLASEDQQLAWAAKESLRLEEDRKKRQLQEQADLELAIHLSKAESKIT